MYYVNSIIFEIRFGMASLWQGPFPKTSWKLFWGVSEQYNLYWSWKSPKLCKMRRGEALCSYLWLCVHSCVHYCHAPTGFSFQRSATFDEVLQFPCLFYYRSWGSNYQVRLLETTRLVPRPPPQPLVAWSVGAFTMYCFVVWAVVVVVIFPAHSQHEKMLLVLSVYNPRVSSLLAVSNTAHSCKLVGMGLE